jgi:hypothetical protein
MRAQVGDRLLVEGDEARMGLIISVPQADGSPPYIVKWLSNGHIAAVSPGMFARLIPAGHPAGTAPVQLAGPAHGSESFATGSRDLGPALAQVAATIVEMTWRARPRSRSEDSVQ